MREFFCFGYEATFNHRHPELRYGEAFFTNTKLDFSELQADNPNVVLRKGNVAYDCDGNKLFDENYYPVFRKIINNIETKHFTIE